LRTPRLSSVSSTATAFCSNLWRDVDATSGRARQATGLKSSAASAGAAQHTAWPSAQRCTAPPTPTPPHRHSTQVDAKNVSRHLDEAEADPERVSEAVEQVAMADVILLNKSDLVSFVLARRTSARTKACSRLRPTARGAGTLTCGGEGGGGLRQALTNHQPTCAHHEHTLADAHAFGMRCPPLPPPQVAPEFLTSLKGRLRRVNALAPITTTSRAQVGRSLVLRTGWSVLGGGGC
jgi:hypothetical protein